MKVRDLPAGSILWSKDVNPEDGEYEILGVKDMTLSKDWYDWDCVKVEGNSRDYELVENIFDDVEAR